MTSTVVSAPGKVLIAGGYLVLDAHYSGLVVSTSSRFYTAIRPSTDQVHNIDVRSPQFASAAWTYRVDFEEGVAVSQTSKQDSKNKFVELALQKSLQLIGEIKGLKHVQDILVDGLDVAIVGHNDFYSQRAKLAELQLPPLIDSLTKIPPFSHTGVQLTNVHKTGLGSSAALITSLVTALLVHFGAIEKDALESVDHQGRLLAHNTAQYIHCLAQGKVGSGFDVSSAVFGSQIYKRFGAGILADIMAPSGTPSSLHSVLSPSNGSWDYEVLPFRLPPHTRLMLADVDAGSDTPSMAGKVLKWRKETGESADALWNDLSASNDALARTLLQLGDLYAQNRTGYLSAVKALSGTPSAGWTAASTDGNAEPIISLFREVNRLTEDIRAKMRLMGEKSGVPIEPPEQTELLNACVGQLGVVGGGVPGAGGYDALWLLVLESPDRAEADSPLHHVETLWSQWTKLDVSPLSASESFEKGVRLEELTAVPGLQDVISQ